MSIDQPDNSNLLSSILALSIEERIAILNAIHVSLADSKIDHGSDEPAELVEAAWKEEIEQRIADIDHGHVKTIPAKVAEEMIRGDVRPEF